MAKRKKSKKNKECEVALQKISKTIKRLNQTGVFLESSMRRVDNAGRINPDSINSVIGGAPYLV